MLQETVMTCLKRMAYLYNDIIIEFLKQQKVTASTFIKMSPMEEKLDVKIKELDEMKEKLETFNGDDNASDDEKNELTDDEKKELTSLLPKVDTLSNEIHELKHETTELKEELTKQESVLQEKQQKLHDFKYFVDAFDYVDDKEIQLNTLKKICSKNNLANIPLLKEILFNSPPHMSHLAIQILIK